MGRKRTGSVKIVDGKIYARVAYIDKRGKRHEITKRAASYEEAKQLNLTMIQELAEYGSKIFEGATMTFEQLADFYEKTYIIDPKYVNGRKVAGLKSKRNAILYLGDLRAYFGKQKIQSITRSQIEEYKITRIDTPRKQTDKPRSLAGIHRELALLRRMLNVAKEEGWLTRNPFGKGLISPADEVVRDRILTRQEEALLLNACVEKRSHLRPIIIIALDTGMRQGEIFKLKWEDINWASKLISIKAFNTKTMKARQVAMTARVEKELWQLWALSQASNPDPSKLVFDISTNCKKSFGTLRKNAGIADIRFHDLRHTAATRMIEGGIPIQQVGRLLGHTQVNTTYRYINANANTAMQAANALDILNLQAESVRTEETK